MDTESAYYYYLLLSNSIDEGYDGWLDSYLESEDPLSEIVLNLALCGCDTQRTLAILHTYSMERKFDEAKVCKLLRQFFLNKLQTQQYTLEQACRLMYQVAKTHEDPRGFDSNIWGSLYFMEDLYDLTQLGLVDQAQFLKALYAYLLDGIPMDYNQLTRN